MNQEEMDKIWKNGFMWGFVLGIIGFYIGMWIN